MKIARQGCQNLLVATDHRDDDVTTNFKRLRTESQKVGQTGRAGMLDSPDPQLPGASNAVDHKRQERCTGINGDANKLKSWSKDEGSEHCKGVQCELRLSRVCTRSRSNQQPRYDQQRQLPER